MRLWILIMYFAGSNTTIVIPDIYNEEYCIKLGTDIYKSFEDSPAKPRYKCFSTLFNR